MNPFIDSLVARAKSDRKTIVLPESEDVRTLEAAQMVLEDDFVDVILIGDPATIGASPYDVSKATIVDPQNYEKSDELAQLLFELRQHKGMTAEKAHELVKDELHLGVLLVKAGIADGMVAGACHATSDVLRPSLQILRTAPGAKLVSSFMIMVVPNCDLGEDGTFLFADIGLEVQPDAERLANIAVNAADSFELLVKSEPRVAMLSHSSYGSASNDDSLKVVEATKIAKELAPERAIDGELQLDAAIIPEIAASKAPDSPVAGHANVLVFPDLDAGNIGYKLVQRLAHAEAYGPVTQGIAAPVNDLSRGCNAQDIYGVVAITAIQAQK